ncbi:MAG: N-acetylmuramoyl-L-alanine amidase [Bacteroidota bacterium]
MKNIFLLLAFLSVQLSMAQHLKVPLSTSVQDDKVVLLKNESKLFRSRSLAVPFQQVEPLLAYAITATDPSADLKLWIRFSEDGTNWKDWEKVQRDAHEAEEDTQWVSELRYANANDRFYQYKWRADVADYDNLTLHFYNPRKTEQQSQSTVAPLESRSCPCPQPAFEGREDWCPAGNCPKDETPAPNSVTHLIVHHSAGVNNANDWAAIVRSIWDFHVNTRGWDDVGYNWLIDPNGVLYEGRGTDLIGAHFCGTNTATEGICLLGTFTTITPKAAAVEKLTEFLAWKSCQEGLYPIDRVRHSASGRNLLQVSGHRDGCATACPGEAFYPLLNEVRTATIDYIDNVCNISSLLPAPFALSDSLINNEAVLLNWAFDLPDANVDLSLERSVGEDYRYEEVLRLPADATSYRDEAIESNQLYFYRLRALAAGEASAYSNKVLVSTIVSNTNQHLTAERVQIFPNPAKSTLQLSIENAAFEPIEIEIRDLSGRTLQSINFPKVQTDFQQELDLANLPSGLYVISIRQAQELYALKLVKQ